MGHNLAQRHHMAISMLTHVAPVLCWGDSPDRTAAYARFVYLGRPTAHSSGVLYQPVERNPHMAQHHFAERLEALKQHGLVALVVKGTSEAEIAQHFGMHRSTLQPYIRAVKTELGAQRETETFRPASGKRRPKVRQHPPREHKAIPSTGVIGPPEEPPGPPPLYVHQGLPDGCAEESVLGAEAIEGLQQGIPPLPLVGMRVADHEPPPAPLPESPPTAPQGIALPVLLLEDLQQAWPELQDMLAWWRARRQGEESSEQLERVTYHVAPQWIAAVKHEAERTGESSAAVVNRAFRRYFEGR
jgi:DNA-binding CsgD family transcriptional regulator